MFEGLVLELIHLSFAGQFTESRGAESDVEERVLAWLGLMAEPLPGLFPLLVRSQNRSRRGDAVAHFLQTLPRRGGIVDHKEKEVLVVFHKPGNRVALDVVQRQ